ncbi:MAG TPA: 1,2-phenylacetyl-CoA epoxidase subunit PaaC, partial [Anaerolineales bacterium]|nr:1,2-phenylacetyl-CoA epoxidase subunit PaaC [Anaerolineales bacterium]
MNEDLRRAAADYVLSLADDEMILSHRDSEWTGHAPILEEDIAFANIALDEMGHALLWYQVYSELVGEDPERWPDRLVFQRAADAFRHTPLVELPNGDWARSMLRQFLFDAAELVWLEDLAKSAYPPIAAVARKIINEERYHDRHTRAWVRRLGLGTDESRRRMQRALDDLWPHLADLTAPRPQEDGLVAAGVCPSAAAVRARWLADVLPTLEAIGLRVPEGFAPSEF